MRFQRAWIFSASCFIILLATFLSGCPQIRETPGHRPEPQAEQDPQQQASEEKMERLTAEWAYTQGMLALDRRQTADAVRYFQLAIKRDAMHLDAYLRLGDLYSMQQKYLPAESYYNKVLRYDPESIPAYSALGTMYREMGNYRESLSFYRKVQELDPGNQDAEAQIAGITKDLFKQHYEQGMAYKHAGELEKALIELQKAQSLDPENVEFSIELAELLLQQGDYVSADSYFQHILSRDPDNPQAIIGLGKVQLAQKHYDEALQHFERARALQPHNSELKRLIQDSQMDRVSHSLPPQYHEISRKEQVTRGDLAALLMVELMMGSRLPASDRVAIISDITTHWAKLYIIQAVQLRLMALPPDRYFRPDEPVRKGQLAFILDTIARQLSVQLPEGNAVSFADVYPENQYYDAILRFLSAKLMNAESQDRFGISSPVSGEETLQIFQKFKALL